MANKHATNNMQFIARMQIVAVSENETLTCDSTLKLARKLHITYKATGKLNL